jgi:hypothetical protein
MERARIRERIDHEHGERLARVHRDVVAKTLQCIDVEPARAQALVDRRGVGRCGHHDRRLALLQSAPDELADDAA